MSTDPNPPVQPDLAGYDSVESLVKAHRSSGSEAKRLADENRRQSEEIQRLQQAQQSAFSPRQEINQRSANPADRLADYGIPVDALDQYLNTAIQERVVGPMVQLAGAKSRVLKDYPDYGKHEAAVAQYIEEDQERTSRYQKMFSADPVGAIEWSIGQYTEHQRRTRKDTRDEQRQAQSEAQIPSGRQAESRSSDTQYQEALQQAEKRARETGRREDIERFASLRFRQGISKSFYETGHPERR